MICTGLIKVRRVGEGFEVSVGDRSWSVDVLRGISLIGDEGCVEGVVRIEYREVVEGYDPVSKRWRARTVASASVHGIPVACG
jgi:hypothetical protein